MKKILIRLFYVWPATAVCWTWTQAKRANIALEREAVEKDWRKSRREMWRQLCDIGSYGSRYVDRLRYGKLEARDK